MKCVGRREHLAPIQPHLPAHRVLRAEERWTLDFQEMLGGKIDRDALARTPAKAPTVMAKAQVLRVIVGHIDQITLSGFSGTQHRLGTLPGETRKPQAHLQATK